MSDYVITKDRLIELLSEYIKSRTVIAPIRNEFDEILLKPVVDINEICFNYENTVNSVKDYFLPQSESIFSFSNQKNVEIKPIIESEQTLIFGLRACDTKALQLLDKFFGRQLEDNIYFQKRRASLVFTLACEQCWDNCFCNAMNSGPILDNGFDFQIIPIKDKFLLQVGSEKARQELDKISSYLLQAENEERKEVLSIKSKFAKCKPAFDLKKVYKNLKQYSIKTEIWQDISFRCQMCGLCLFICPTCCCFTVLDRIYLDATQERIRQWDACYFLGFTRLAGGDNPVKSKVEMVKRKYEHKLLQQIDEFDICGCTGCGRCIYCCLGNVNWLENIIRMQ